MHSKSDPPPQNRASEAEKRAEALRQNLLKRKQQARARNEETKEKK